jgi:hypothetical protein
MRNLVATAIFLLFSAIAIAMTAPTPLRARVMADAASIVRTASSTSCGGCEASRAETGAYTDGYYIIGFAPPGRYTVQVWLFAGKGDCEYIYGCDQFYGCQFDYDYTVTDTLGATFHAREPNSWELSENGNSSSFISQEDSEDEWADCGGEAEFGVGFYTGHNVLLGDHIGSINFLGYCEPCEDG